MTEAMKKKRDEMAMAFGASYPAHEQIYGVGLCNATTEDVLNMNNRKMCFSEGFSACHDLLMPEVEKLVDEVSFLIDAPDSQCFSEARIRTKEALASWRKFMGEDE